MWFAFRSAGESPVLLFLLISSRSAATARDFVPSALSTASARPVCPASPAQSFGKKIYSCKIRHEDDSLQGISTPKHDAQMSNATSLEAIKTERVSQIPA